MYITTIWQFYKEITCTIIWLSFSQNRGMIHTSFTRNNRLKRCSFIFIIERLYKIFPSSYNMLNWRNNKIIKSNSKMTYFFFGPSSFINRSRRGRSCSRLHLRCWWPATGNSISTNWVIWQIILTRAAVFKTGSRPINETIY